MTTAETNHETLPMLNEQRLAIKKVIAERQKDLLTIERGMLAHPDTPKLPTKGTTDLGPCKVVTKQTESWDQDKLEAIRIREDIGDEHWPFISVWKPDTTAMKFLSERHPGFIQTIKDAALTVKDAKPAFHDKKVAA